MVDRAGRDATLISAYVSVAELLVDNFDVNDLFHRLTSTCVEVLGAATAGLMLTDFEGRPTLVASSNAAMQALEEMELTYDEGPCLDCFSTAEALSVDLRTQLAARWPRFGPAAAQAGFVHVQALPLRVRHDVLGALNLFHRTPDPFDSATTTLAQSLADLASIALLQHGAHVTPERVTLQLQDALNDRIVLAQAKGLLAELGNLDVDLAFATLRRYCEVTGLRLTRVARQLVNRELAVAEVLGPGQHSTS